MFELPTWGWLRRDIKSQREAVERWLKSGVGEGRFLFLCILPFNKIPKTAFSHEDCIAE
jgi:hypothetical protein